MSTLFKKRKKSPKVESDVSTNAALKDASEVKSVLKTVKEVPTNISTFDDLKLTAPLQQTCNSLGYKQPTPVQKCVIPFLIENTSSHILALSSTGSGKTAAFVLPILHHLSYDPYEYMQ